MTDKEGDRLNKLIASLEKETSAQADEIERLAEQVKDAKELIINLLNKAKEYMDD